MVSGCVHVIFLFGLIRIKSAKIYSNTVVTGLVPFEHNFKSMPLVNLSYFLVQIKKMA